MIPIPAVAALFDSRAAKIGLVAIVIAALLAGAGIAFWRGMARIDGMVEAVRVEATKARDAFWQGEIAKANALAERARADQIAAAAAADRQAAEQIARLEDQLDKLERENATLPNGDACGLGAGRVRLLPR